MGLISPGGYAGFFAPAIDLDAQAFITAAGLTNSVQINAVNTLVLDLKQQGLWSLLTLLYPFVGGSAVAHSVNLKTPGQYNLTWSGTETHSPQGLTYGATGSDTGFTLPNVNPYYGVYVVGGATVSASDFHTAFTPRVNFYSTYDGTSYSDLGDYAGGRLKTNTDATKNRYAATCRLGTVHSIYSGPNSVAQSTSSSTQPVTGTVRINGLGTDAGAGRTTALSVVAQALTTPQHVALYNAIQAFQVALGRAV